MQNNYYFVTLKSNNQLIPEIIMATLEIFCKNINDYVTVEGGATLSEIYAKVADKINITPICARVNNKNESLSFRVYSPKLVEFLDRRTPSGDHAYVRSLFMMLNKAITDLYAGAKLHIHHSLSNGYYCTIENLGKKLEQADVDAILARMRELVKLDLPFKQFEKLTTDVIEVFNKVGLTDKARLLSNTHELYSRYNTLDGMPDFYYSVLAPSTGYLKFFDLKIYKEGLLLLSASRKADAVNTPVPQHKMYEAFCKYRAFNSIIGVQDVGQLNEAIENGNEGLIVNVSEALHTQALSEIAQDIAGRFRQGGARIVMLSGPSSSGKTTTAKRLSIQLLTNLIYPKMISLDNYFVNREDTPKDETGDYDFESLYALDLEQFNKDLAALLRGEEVAMPTYDFPSGTRKYLGNTLKLNADDILVMEGIHGLNPELTPIIPADQKYKVYTSALTSLNIDNHNQIPTSDNRLIRRIVRDAQFRGTPIIDTISRWKSVRAGEEKWIFPYQENADAMFNSSLIYELTVMRELAEPMLAKVPHDVPEYAEASRLMKFLRFFKPIQRQYIPSTSILREFLGGSSFKY